MKQSTPDSAPTTARHLRVVAFPKRENTTVPFDARTYESLPMAWQQWIGDVIRWSAWVSVAGTRPPQQSGNLGRPVIDLSPDDRQGA